jgi:hypothetical protein
MISNGFKGQQRCGYILKPSWLLSPSLSAFPINSYTGITVKVLSARQLPKRKGSLSLLCPNLLLNCADAV